MAERRSRKGRSGFCSDAFFGGLTEGNGAKWGMTMGILGFFVAKEKETEPLGLCGRVRCLEGRHGQVGAAMGRHWRRVTKAATKMARASEGVTGMRQQRDKADVSGMGELLA